MLPTLAKFRSALKFTLWTWAAYWPGGGLILMGGGLDPISIVITMSSLLVFLALVMGGVFRSDLTTSWKEFLLQRPIYLAAALAAFIAMASVIPIAEGLGLALFASVYLFGVGLAIVRLNAYVRELGRGAFKARADQAYIVLGFTIVFASFVFWDAVVPLMGGPQAATPAVLVALGTWINLLYPVSLMVATRGLRDPLTWGRMVGRPVATKRAKSVVRKGVVTPSPGY